MSKRTLNYGGYITICDTTTNMGLNACPINCFPYIDSLSLVKTCEKDPAIYRLHEFCIPGWAQDNDPEADTVTGHLSPGGHEKFSYTIKSILEDIHENI